MLKLTPDSATTWTDNEVIARWTSLFKGPLLVRRYQNAELLTAAERQTINEIVAVWRKRLTELSWFMKCLNEPIARAANKEDQCTGHFWEARYKSQALLTEQALLSCLAYVDLNPIRAGIANTPETSDYTSIRERIKPEFDSASAVVEQIEQKTLCRFELPLKPLLPFSGSVTDKYQSGIGYDYSHYLELVDWTGRSVREDKRGSIPSHLPPILERLGISGELWLASTQSFEQLHSKLYRKRIPGKLTA